MPSPALEAALRWWTTQAQLALERVVHGDHPGAQWSEDFKADCLLIAAELARQDEDYGDAAERLCVTLDQAPPKDAHRLIVAALVDAARAGREQMRVEMGDKCACQTPDVAPGCPNGGEKVSKAGGAPQDPRAEVVA